MGLRTKDDKTRLSYWFPIIRDAGLPVPRTEIVRANGHLYDFFDGKMPACLPQLESDIAKAASVIGTPFFLRTDYTSAKHGWLDTCFVRDIADLRSHIYQITELSECDILGLPTDVWVVREMLSTEPAFTAFNGMPITKEFRYFVRDGLVEHRQPYWPPDAIEGHCEADWHYALKSISEILPEDHQALARLSEAAGSALGGYWSIDWLWTTDRGWVLTDCAEGDHSFKWDGR